MIIVDKREPNFYSSMLKSRHIEVKREQLDIGDYLLPDSTVIERKTISDFLGSIIDGRIWIQAKNLTQYDNPMIVIETQDKWKNFYFSNAKYPHKIYYSAISALAYSFSIPVITVDSKYDTIDFIEALWKKITAKPTSRPVKKMRQAASFDEVREDVLAQIPGISIVKAKALLHHFKTIQKIARAKEDELTSVEGIGKKLAQTIVKILQGEYGGE